MPCEVDLKRRQFLLSSAAVAAVPLLERSVLFAARPNAEGIRSPLASAQVIWSADAPPVPILGGGVATEIASSSSGPRPQTTPDLHSIFAKEIQLRTSPNRALLHLFAFTRYRLYVNGIYIDRGPCRYQNQRPEYDTHDLQQHLRAGKNTLVVLVHRDAPTGRIMRHDPGFVAALELGYGSKTQFIGTDASWLSTPDRSFGPRAEAWASIEEHIDARQTPNGSKLSDWTQPDLTQSFWQPSVVVAGNGETVFYPRVFYPRSSPPQVASERPLTLQPDHSHPAASSVAPFDLSPGSEISFNLPGVTQAFHLLEMDADEGSLLEIAYALPEGSSGTSTYIARSGHQTYMGGDTFACSQLQLRLRSGRMRLTRVAAFEVRYPFQRAASFACSDPFFTQLWEICARSLEILSEDSYVDCADRERVEWTDDSPPAFDCTRVMMRGPDDEQGSAHWGDARLLRGLLRRIALTQQPDGQLKAHSCSERFDVHAIMEDRTCDWIVQLREYYEGTGDTELVRELWPTLNRVLDWFRNHRTPRGLVLAREWEVWDNPLRYQVCEGAGLNAMFYMALTSAATLARSIAKVDEAASLAQEAERLRTDFNQLLWNPQQGAYDGGLFGPGSEIRPQMGQPFTGKIVDGRFHPTLQANLFSLFCGVVPPERVDSVRRYALSHIAEITQPMSFYYLFQMQYAMQEELQDSEALKRMKTAWKTQVDSPWQTTWETWDPGGSKIHIYGMFPGYFLTAFVLGARRDGPVEQRKLLLEPRFSGLDWAKGVCVTEFGPVEVDWRRNSAGAVSLLCTIPDRVHTTLRLRPLGQTGSVILDHQAVSAHRVNGWLEIALPAGRHTVQLQA